MTRRSDAFRRGLRTLFDIAFVGAVLQVLIEFGIDITDGQYKALMLLGGFVVAFGKNSLEDAGTIPALLKATPSSGANPVPDPRPNRLTADE